MNNKFDEIKRNDILGPGFGYRKYKEDDLYRVRPHSPEYYLLLANNTLYDEYERTGEHANYEEFKKQKVWLQVNPNEYEDIERIKRARATHNDYIQCLTCGEKMHRSLDRELTVTPNVTYVCPKCGCAIRTHHIAKDAPCERYIHPVKI